MAHRHSAAYQFAIGRPNPGLYFAPLAVVFLMLGVVLLLNGLGIGWQDYRRGMTWKLGEYLPDKSYRIADEYSHAFRVVQCYRASEPGVFF